MITMIKLINNRLKYFNKKLKFKLNDLNDIILNGYQGTDNNLKTYFKTINKDNLIKYLLNYNLSMKIKYLIVLIMK